MCDLVKSKLVRRFVCHDLLEESLKAIFPATICMYRLFESLSFPCLSQSVLILRGTELVFPHVVAMPFFSGHLSVSFFTLSFFLKQKIFSHGCDDISRQHGTLPNLS